MVFSSFAFIWIFLPLALLVYFAAFRHSVRSANWALALLGYAFYAWSTPKFLVLMWATTAVDWSLGLIIAGNSLRFWRNAGRVLAVLPSGGERTRLQRNAVLFSVVLNLSSLGFFKYSGFALETAQSLAALLGTSVADHPTLYIALPLGISFYTFQSLSYIVDVYRGDAGAMTRFGDFACFVSMFPHLVAGPILRFAFLSKQLESRSVTREKIVRGVALFGVGLSKKVLLANSVGMLVDTCFAASHVTALQAWCGVVGYAMQVYFDFSAYSDMAVGVALMLGFIFARNFDSPYRADSLTDFWRRWHISLSSWLRAYLYIPLGGSRRGPVRTYVNLVTTMVLGGLWHGAAWTYVIWGGIHGGALAVERAGASRWLERLPRNVRVALVFLVVTNAWVFFRAENLSKACRYLASMYGFGASSDIRGIVSAVAFSPLSVAALGASLIVVWFGVDAWQLTARLSWPRAILLSSLTACALALMSVQSYNPFIYFIF